MISRHHSDRVSHSNMIAVFGGRMSRAPSDGLPFRDGLAKSMGDSCSSRSRSASPRPPAYGPVTLRRANFTVPAGKVYFTLSPVMVTLTPSASVSQAPLSVEEVSTQKSVAYVPP